MISKAIAFIFVCLLIVYTDASFLSRECECKAVTDTIHFGLKSWDISSCKLCGCDNAAMTNCQSACKSLVESYAKTGCGKAIKGSVVKYKWDAGRCSKGTSKEKFVCA